jgi:2-amino-4-hydroxy-6-hydroxymethyldihydropteridine diphosphokinase
MRRAVAELERVGVQVLAISRLYRSRPIGLPRQPEFWNAALLVEPRLSPAMLLRASKRFELQAGRRVVGASGARPLDIDIVDFGGMRVGRPGPIRRRGQLILPHPEATRRAFVLRPLRDVARHWQHPSADRSIAQLIAHLAVRPGDIREAVDPASLSCNLAEASGSHP